MVTNVTALCGATSPTCHSSFAGTGARSADSFLGYFYLFPFIDENIFSTYASRYRSAIYQH
jgi:hypothetical protein